MNQNHQILIAIILFFVCVATLHAQQENQTMRGVVVDNDTKDPISYVVIEILNFSPPKSTTTDKRGHFEINKIPTGAYKIALSHPDYMSIIISELYVGTGQEAILKINMDRAFVNRNKPEVTTAKPAPRIVPQTALNNQTSKNNIMGLEIGNTIKPADIQRVPYSFGDPSRVLAKFGSAYNRFDQTGLWVRGHHPNYTQWRIEGLPVSSPNHLAMGAGNTGYMPIFNTSSLQSASLYNGLFPAEYGNALNSVMDVDLRSGNRFGIEGSAEVNAAGIGGVLEGALGKENKNAFLVGFRAGYLPDVTGILSPYVYPLPRVRDITFNLNSKTLNTETNVFGIGGMSSMNVLRKQVLPHTRYTQYRGDVRQEKTYGVFGISFKDNMYARKGYYKITLGTNYNGEKEIETINGKQIGGYNSQNTATSLLGYYHHTFNKTHQVRVGGGATHYYLDYWAFNRDNPRFATRDYRGHSLLGQVHAQWLWQLGEQLELTTGVQAQYLLWNNDYSISPRFALAWQLAKSHRITFGYAWNHQMQPWEVYLNVSNESATAGQMLDKDLKFIQSQHTFLAYEWRIGAAWQIKLEGFYQRLYGVPTYTRNPNLLLTNHSPNQNLWELTGYENNGKGWHYGGEVTLQKYFSKGYYGIFSATYFEARYEAKDGSWVSKEGNHQANSNLMIGKEFNIGKNKTNRFFVEANYLYRRGDRYTPIDLQASIAENRRVLDWSSAYQQRYPSTHQVDVRVGFTINAKKKLLAHRFFVELHNALHRKTVYEMGYNPLLQRIESYRYQGMVPSITYKVNFGFNPVQ